MLQKTITLDSLCQELEGARKRAGVSKRRHESQLPDLIAGWVLIKREEGVRVVL